jgi:hypothetical protein
MKNLYLLSYLLVLTTGLIAQTDGPRNPGSYSNVAIPGSNRSWLLPENTVSSDNSYSNFFSISGGVGSYTDYLVVTNFGFNIPAGVFIKGIRVEVERSDPNARTSDYRVRIVKGGVIGNADRSVGALPTADTYNTYGGMGDLWGETWSNTDINSANFGFAIALQRSVAGGNTAARIDHIRITILYDNAMTLPVRLQSFVATPQNNSVLLKWRTSDETNMSHYTVERSANGSDFSSLQNVTSQNNPFSTDYSYTDLDPISGVAYYRIRMTGNSGEAKYSFILSVQFSESGNIDLYPTLLSPGQIINVRSSLSDRFTINFYTHTGQKVATLTSVNRVFNTAGLEKQKGVLYYQIFRENGLMAGTGRVMLQ